MSAKVKLNYEDNFIGQDPYKARKFLGLELMRFLCAASVLIWHYHHVANGRPFQELPFYRFLSFFYHGGGKAVQVFWVLSGFIFYWKYSNSILKRQTGALNFLILRFSRLYPLHFITLIITAILQYLYSQKYNGFFITKYNDLQHFFLNLFFISGWGFEKGYSFNGPIWSVSVELISYFVFFVASLISSATWFSGLILAVSMFLYAAIGKSVILECIALFYIGAVSYKVYCYLEVLSKKSLGMRVIIFLLLIILIFLFDNQIVLAWRKNIMLIYALVVPGIMFSFLTILPVLPKKSAPIVQQLGAMTYASYLLHFPLQILAVYILSNFSNYKDIVYTKTFFIAFNSFVLIASLFTYHFVEIPLQNKIRQMAVRVIRKKEG